MPHTSIVAAMLNGEIETPKDYRRGKVSLNSLSWPNGVTVPAIFSYGRHFPMAVQCGIGGVYYNEDRYSATTAGHQAMVRGQLKEAGYRATEHIKELRLANSSHPYTFRLWLPLSATAGRPACPFCHYDYDVHFDTPAGLYDHLRAAHPRKGKEEAAGVLARYGPF